MARFPNPSPALPPNARRTCRMPYFPDPGVDARVHSQTAGCKFHVVKEGFIKGCFTNANAATLQVEGCSGNSRCSTNTEDEAKHEWAYHCYLKHGTVCPAAEEEARVAAALDAAQNAPKLVPRFTSDDILDTTWCSARDVMANKNHSSMDNLSAAFPAFRVSVSEVDKKAPVCSPSPMKSKSQFAPPASPMKSQVVAAASPMKAQSAAPTNASSSATVAFARMGTGPPIAVHWGIKGVLRTFASRDDAIEAAEKLGIHRTMVAGDANPAVVEAWVRS
ncbi:hypothetical protein C8R43DRAFT_1123524 [Mycena crocata]|nr:hypothetical protein C8R43DRAFT_1123524 [Mycena crocata]